MLNRKVKTYNIMLSRSFPATHPKAGQETGFAQKVMAAIGNTPCHPKKLHTIRANYDLWKKRIYEVMAGKAVLCLRQWTGKPYRSKTVVIKTLTAADGIGIQKLNFNWSGTGLNFIEEKMLHNSNLADNDGLSLNDWQAWFRGYDHSKPLAIIHFTNFRY